MSLNRVLQVLIYLNGVRMAQLTCGCLNIQLHIQESLQALVPTVPSLTSQESHHPFFLKGVYFVTLSLGGVTEAQKFLVKETRVGGWTVYECLNCHFLTHATKSGSSSVVASTTLIRDANKIQMLQRGEGYSPVFNLVLPTSIDNRPLPPQSPTDFSNDRSPETEEALKAIQQTMAKFLKKAEAQVEGNVRAYSEKQQAALSALQVRARRDRQTIMRMLAHIKATTDSHDDDPLETFEMDGATGNFKSTPGFTFKDEGRKDDDLLEDETEMVADVTDLALPPLVSAQSRSSQPMSVNPVQSLTGGVRNLTLSSSMAIPQVKPQGNVRVAQSLDVEGLFDMEGLMEGTGVMPPQPPNYQSDDDDDDDDTDDSNHDEGIHIPGGRMPGVRDLAQSVPVNVPMWANPRVAKSVREPIIIERPSDTNQMAASIQALARSVHTTSVDLFGDLPRPRQPF
ncbi:hypothetical protein Pcinc_034361 [Petrolisthes cinctipes]|uniref:Proline-rich AKT1 substrate 1 n=1 Tax=Petrolisthes cinctipes TaxID=88211 RepID=A0AAE1JWW9_PETCI|nr:hypothetical protein Pcinc_034361 [Petrolisthes cinctipes]